MRRAVFAFHRLSHGADAPNSPGGNQLNTRHRTVPANIRPVRFAIRTHVPAANRRHAESPKSPLQSSIRIRVFATVSCAFCRRLYRPIVRPSVRQTHPDRPAQDHLTSRRSGNVFRQLIRYNRENRSVRHCRSSVGSRNQHFTTFTIFSLPIILNIFELKLSI